MSSDNLFDEMEIVRYSRKDGLEKVEDPVVRETSLRIFVNDREIVVLQSLLHDVKELALGFLFTECVLRDPSAVKEIKIKDGLHVVTVITDVEIPSSSVPTIRSVTSGCGAGVSFVDPMQSKLFKKLESSETMKAETIILLMRQLLKASKLFRETGGVHTAALSDGEKLVYIADDIGRHNCIDKIVGWLLLNRDSKFTKKIMLSSGRLSSDIVAKSVRGGVEFLISHSAPTRGAVQLAREFGITLVGFTRGDRFNIYSNEERIII